MKRTLFLKTLALVIGLLFQTTMSWGQLLVENFDYPIGDLLTNHGWTAHSGAGSQPIDVTSGLSFTGYIGSGIGGAANLDNTGEDDNKTFAPQTTGTVYAAFVIQTQNPNSAQYFLNFGQAVISTIFFTRVWVNGTGTGVGLSGSSAPATYATITPGVPTFLVIKYDITTKISSLYVFTTFPASEPTTANSTFNETGTYANVGSIALRQGSSNAQRVIVDGIRVATTWADAVTASGSTPIVDMPTFTPTPGVTENPVDVTISCTTPNSSIYYTLDGSEPNNTTSTLFTLPIPISSTTTVKARAYATGFDPSSIAAGNYIFRTPVATIAELRAGTTGVPYLLTGEVYVTYFQLWRNQIFVQDYTGAILIDDASNTIITEYEIGDGFTGLKGSLTLYQGMLQYVPANDPGDPSGGHLFTPEIITINDLNTNFENYESELVKIENATFTAGATAFNSVTPTAYEITDVSLDAIGYFRTTFLDANYLGTTIPVGPTTIIGICNQAGSPVGNYITSRSSADIIPASVIPTIIVTSPDGGEFWQRGTTETITWGSLNFTGNVTIQLISGFFTTTIATNIANTGTHDWAIPAGQNLASNYKIRVKGVNAGDPTDDSNGSFSIVEYVGLPRIVINEIMYNSIEAADNEWIELYNREAIPIDLGGFLIKDNLNTHIITIPAGYSILPGAYFTVAVKIGTAPLFFTPNYSANASWSFDNSGDQVRLYAPGEILVDSLQYSPSSPWPTGANGTGPSLELIDPTLDNTLPQSWLASAATNGTPGAQNSMFNFQSLTVTSPNGTEIWEQGSTHPITWTSVNFTGTIKIELETVAKGLVTLAENIPAADGTWSWAIPAGQAVGSNYKIKISDQADGNPMDESNAVFSIVAPIPPSLTVTSPNGGESWEQGTTHAITWTSVNFAGTIKIELETVAKGLVILAENVAVTDLTWSWVIPAGQTPGTNFKIKISDQADGDPMDQSNATFSIIEVIPPSITVTVPNGGEQWEQGATHAITWTKVNFTGNVKIELSDGAKTLTVLNASIAASLGTWSWLIPADQALASTYTIIISGLVAGEPTDASNAPFSIIAPLPLPNLVINEIMYNPDDIQGLIDTYYEFVEIYNNGNYTIDLSGYKFSVGITYTFPQGKTIGAGQYLVVALLPDTIISHYGISNVVGPFSGGLSNSGEAIRIDNAAGLAVDNLTFDDAAPWPLTPDGNGPSLSLLDPNLDNSLGASWAASSQNGGTPGKINFPPLPTLTVVYPNGGENLLQGATVNITWNSTVFTGDIKIELVETTTNTAVVLFASVPVSDGNINWLVSEAARSDYKIKISDVVDGDPMDESNAVFSIAAPIPPSLTVTSPNGGESWEQGTTHPITWTSENFAGTIKIELETVAKGLVTLAENIPVADGTWNWTILADQAAGSNYKIKISDQVDGSPMDQSDAVFSIIAIPAFPKIVITEIYYNGPESGTDSTEFIEIYNNDVISVNLQGWYFSLGIVFTFPNFDLAPGAHFVSAIKASAMLNTFGVTAYQWTSGGLSNSGERIELKNAGGEVIDSLTYKTSAPWPTAANGNGPSLSLCDPSSDNSMAANWSPCIEYVKDNAAGTGIYATPGAGCSGAQAQTMIVPTGWSGISTYINPTNPGVENMFAHIINAVVVVQDFSKVYLPTYGVNTIGNWDTQAGYQSKLTAAKYFVIKGVNETNKTLDLATGWNSLPVISTCSVSVASFLAIHPEIILVKEMGSTLVYWPSQGLNTLITLVPGRAYLIKVSAPLSLTFPECGAMDNVVPQEPAREISSIWNEVTPTGASHAIGFTSSSLTDLHAGDIIGAFSSNGQCAGITEVGEGNALIMAWADDVYTFETDGFTEEEGFSYKVYRPSTAEVFDVTAIYDNSAPNTGSFATNGISLVKELKMGATGIGTQNTRVRIYPNPANSVVNIDLMQQFTNVEVYSMVGSLLYSANVSGNFIKLDVSNFEQGVYFLKLINQNSGDQTTTRFIKE